MKQVVLFLIRIYQIGISPIKNGVFPLSSSCRYSPRCSEYTYQAVKKYGVVKGLTLGIKRILSCNPLGGHGFSPLT